MFFFILFFINIHSLVSICKKKKKEKKNYMAYQNKNKKINKIKVGGH